MLVEQRVGLADQVVLWPGCLVQGASGPGEALWLWAGNLAALLVPGGVSIPVCRAAMRAGARC